MKWYYYLFIGYGIYILIRMFLSMKYYKKQRREYKQLLNDVMTNPKYAVKGKWE